MLMDTSHELYGGCLYVNDEMLEGGGGVAMEKPR